MWPELRFSDHPLAVSLTLRNCGMRCACLGQDTPRTQLRYAPDHSCRCPELTEVCRRAHSYPSSSPCPFPQPYSHLSYFP
ncbi:hypothetical protein E2C01_085053 [Portunus trituberculatus]|uniref:Uncharacterized protein n=1 Tax=Portunus trituberculatus TaxID=210409 RepID=A0A5B7J7V4_PORTR|nr:hypothetical protein [Portunus trituberculatus]